MSDQSSNTTRFGVTPVLILTYGGYYLSDTWGSRFETMGYGALCGTILVVLALILIGRACLSENVLAAGKTWVRRRPRVLSDHLPALVMSISMLIYVLAQGWIGFLPATSAMILWLLAFLNAGGAVRILLLAAGLTALAWLLLLELLSVPLPSPPWVV